MSLRERTGWWIYQGAMALGLVGAAPYLLARRGSHYLDTLSGRLGRGGASTAGDPRGALWIHAVSVGEVAVAATLARALPPELPWVITTVTPTGQERARAAFLQNDAPAPRAVTYLPFDLGFAVDRFFHRFDPSALLLVEGDYWPLVLRETRRRGLPVAVVNGRVGKTSAARLRRVPKVARNLFFSAVQTFGVQSAEDRERLMAGGAEGERIRLTGNLKYDTERPSPHPELEEQVRRLADGRPILIAGSTMAGEEEQVLDALRLLGGGERALLILVPRHPERWDGVARLVEAQGFRSVRRTRLGEGATGEGEGSEGEIEVLLLDSLGELAALYAVADIAFIGGTLVPTGGHNPLEPAHFAVPTVVGPSMDNFRDMAARFDGDRAWRRVADAAALAAVWSDWLSSPEEASACGRRAADLLAANRGALGKTLDMLQPLLEAAHTAGARRETIDS